MPKIIPEHIVTGILMDVGYSDPMVVVEDHYMQWRVTEAAVDRKPTLAPVLTKDTPTKVASDGTPGWDVDEIVDFLSLIDDYPSSSSVISKVVAYLETVE